ncbi:MAG: hypothetical protein R3279_05340 [Putridiphycobacter sp.]|nr:hypothetical protein [Putridiphycobacter sp.]
MKKLFSILTLICLLCSFSSYSAESSPDHNHTFKVDSYEVADAAIMSSFESAILSESLYSHNSYTYSITDDFSSKYFSKYQVIKPDNGEKHLKPLNSTLAALSDNFTMTSNNHYWYRNLCNQQTRKNNITHKIYTSTSNYYEYCLYHFPGTNKVKIEKDIKSNYQKLK